MAKRPGVTKERERRGDAFETRHMRGDGARVVHRDKRVSRGLAALLAGSGVFTLALGILVMATNATASKPVPADALPFVLAAIAAISLLLMVLGVLFGVVRTVVTERDVRVKYGLWGPTIPLEDLRSCRVIEYDWTEFGGWGIRRGGDGTWAYVPNRGRVLELSFVANGKDKRVLVGVDDPDETAQQIERARARAVGPRYRVAERADEPEGGTAEVEPAEDDAAEREEPRDRTARAARTKKAR